MVDWGLICRPRDAVSQAEDEAKVWTTVEKVAHLGTQTLLSGGKDSPLLGMTRWRRRRHRRQGVAYFYAGAPVFQSCGVKALLVVCMPRYLYADMQSRTRPASSIVRIGWYLQRGAVETSYIFHWCLTTMWNKVPRWQAQYSPLYAPQMSRNKDECGCSEGGKFL